MTKRQPDNELLVLINEYVVQNIDTFHKKRIESLQKLELKKLLERKNPYLFRIKHYTTAEPLIRSFTDAFISSHEETIFENWLEQLAIFIAQSIYSGKKSIAEGIDLELEKDGIRYIVAIKSGPNWGNSSQIKKMCENFKKAIKTARTSGGNVQIRAVNGCCYGRDDNPDKGDYYKFCGERFWHFVSGEPNLYIELIEPLGYQAKQKNDEFVIAYGSAINRFTATFIQEFCNPDGAINWQKLIEFNSKSKTHIIFP